MSTSGARPRLLVPTLIAVTAALVATALGAWQLQRKAWKEGLIAAMDARLAAALVPLPPASEWPSLTAADAEFRRVKFHAQFEQRPGVWVYVAGSALRDDIKDPGYFAFQPARLDDGRAVVVNRGYVPMDRTVPWTGGSLDVVGLCAGRKRVPGFRHKQIVRHLVRRDPSAMAAARLGSGPVLCRQESPVPPDGRPRPVY